MGSKVSSVEEVLREIGNLDLEDQVYVLDVLNNRLIESRRMEISKRAREAEQAFKAGKVKRGTFEALWNDLNE